MRFASIGTGAIDFPDHCRALLDRGFSGPVIPEIDGPPQSGGYGRNTDDALIDSIRQLRTLIR